ncbi:MAG: TIGR04255 family protein [Myxococcota bacterium]
MRVVGCTREIATGHRVFPERVSVTRTAQEHGLAEGPTFERPPLVEVAAGVQFQPMEGLSIETMARYWELLRDREEDAYPSWTQHPPLQPILESFGAGRSVEVTFDVRSVPPVRSMFTDVSGTHLIQVQPDRFVQNWRKQGDRDTAYPRYPIVRDRFERSLEEFVAFLRERGAEEWIPTLCELTYVNHIEPGAVWSEHGEEDQVLAPLSGAHSDDFLGAPEGVDLNLRYRIPGAEGEPAGRLHVVSRPVFRRADGAPMLRLDLSARSPLQGGVREVSSTLDRCHDFLVRAFQSVTTRRMHETWGLRNDG